MYLEYYGISSIANLVIMASGRVSLPCGGLAQSPGQDYFPQKTPRGKKGVTPTEGNKKEEQQ